MTNHETMTKLECRRHTSLLYLLFWFRHSFVIRHSSFAELLLGTRFGLFSGDQAAIAKRGQRVVHQLHSLLLPGLDNAGKHVGFCFANAVRHGGCISQSFERKDAAAAIVAGNELLADNAAQRFTYHDPDLFLLVDWKNVEKPVEGARGIAGMKRA